MDGGTSGQTLDYYFFMTSNNFTSTNGYRVRYALGSSSSSPSSITLQRITNGIPANDIATYSFSPTTATQSIRVTRQNTLWTLFVGGTSRGTGTDATYAPQISSFQGAQINQSSNSGIFKHGIDNIRYAEFIPPTLNAQYNGEEAKSICNGAAYTLSANPVGGSNCWMTSANWEYAWYTGTGSDATYWNGST